MLSAVLVVSFGRLGDMFGRVRMCTLGFAIFSVASVFLTVTWMHGADGAMWLIIWRVVQGIGGAFLFANAAAIVTDAFPANQRGTALSVNSIAAIAGSFIGLILGGVLAPVNWHLIFLVSAPIGVFGTVWAYFVLHDIGVRKHAQMDWWGNLMFASGLIAILVGITYGLLPYGGHPMGWTNPWVLTALFGGLALLVIFVYVETNVAEPLFRISLFRIRAFTAGNIASLMLAMGRGGMQFMLIIWLQGIWLPLHGYSYSQTPPWPAKAASNPANSSSPASRNRAPNRLTSPIPGTSGRRVRRALTGRAGRWAVERMEGQRVNLGAAGAGRP